MLYVVDQVKITHLFKTVESTQRLGLSQWQEGFQCVHAGRAFRLSISSSGQVGAGEARLASLVQQLFGGARAALRGRRGDILLGLAAYLARRVHRVPAPRHRR